MTTNDNVSTIRCHYCRKIAYWVRPRTGVQVCSSCKGLLVQRNWEELALRWLTHYPREWVNDVAAFIEMEVEREATEMERSVPLTTCDGCDGSVCGAEPHRHRKVLTVQVVVAKNPKARRNVTEN